MAEDTFYWHWKIGRGCFQKKRRRNIIAVIICRGFDNWAANILTRNGLPASTPFLRSITCKRNWVLWERHCTSTFIHIHLQKIQTSGWAYWKAVTPLNIDHKSQIYYWTSRHPHSNFYHSTTHSTGISLRTATRNYAVPVSNDFFCEQNGWLASLLALYKKSSYLSSLTVIWSVAVIPFLILHCNVLCCLAVADDDGDNFNVIDYDIIILVASTPILPFTSAEWNDRGASPQFYWLIDWSQDKPAGPWLFLQSRSDSSYWELNQ